MGGATTASGLLYDCCSCGSYVSGDESFNEANFVECFCADKDIPFRMKRINVPEYIKKTGKSSEIAGRECRYQFFAKVMNECQLTHLALGHHGDDQIETMLMRLTRGSSGQQELVFLL